MKYKVGIIGAGRMGALYDDPMSSMTLTHAHAITRSQKFSLQGFWDQNCGAAQFAAERWSSKAYNTMGELCLDSDIIIVAAPDSVHESILKKIISFNPRLVVCEKPLTLAYASALEVVNLYKRKEIPLYINFQRRFDSQIIKLRNRFISGELGKPIGGTVWYSKGINHNGSHAIDLLRYIYGEPIGTKVYGKTYDYCGNDPTVSGRLEFSGFSIHLLAGHEKFFSIFEVDLMFQHGRYRFSRSGFDLEIQSPKPDPVFSGYRELSVCERTGSDLPFSLEKFTDYIADILEGRALALGTLAEDALLTQKICSKLADGSMD
jgi:predicted dehydrogenase